MTDASLDDVAACRIHPDLFNHAVSGQLLDLIDPAIRATLEFDLERLARHLFIQPGEYARERQHLASLNRLSGTIMIPLTGARRSRQRQRHGDQQG